MAYTKQVWKYSGESGAIPISPANLNHIEDGIGDHVNAVTGNPHAVTAAEVGLGNVPNVTTNNQAPTYSEAGTLANIASGEALSTAFGKIKKAITDFITHKNSTSNPHSVTAAQAGALASDDYKIPKSKVTDYYRDGASAWLKLFTFTASVNYSAPEFEIHGFSNAPNYDGRGDFVVGISGSSDNGAIYTRGILIKAGKGITPASFDFRYEGSGVFSLYFFAPQYTSYVYYAYLTRDGGLSSYDWVKTLTSPSGTAITITWGSSGIGSTANLPVFTGTNGLLETKSASDARTNLGFITASGNVTVAANTQYVDITVTGATTSKKVWVNNNDAVSSLPYIVSARITANNTVRLSLNTTRTSTTTVYYQVLIIG